jgi:peptide/nickel transport system substrate-binding protein
LAFKRATYLLGLACLVLAACGSSTAPAPSDSHATGPYKSVKGSNGGSLTVVAVGDPYGSPDPARADPGYTGSHLRLPGLRSLYGWAPGDESPRPDLAKSAVKMSADGRTATIEIRDDVRYSPPVNRTIAAADFKYAITRGATPWAHNSYFDRCFGNLRGAEDFRKALSAGIAGLQAPDDHTLVMRFTAAEPGKALTDCLSLPLASPVPFEYARKFDKPDGSSYGRHLVFTGPYMVPNGPDGVLTGYEPGKKITFVNNPSWESHSDFRPAYLDAIQIQLGADASAVADVPKSEATVAVGVRGRNLRSPDVQGPLMRRTHSWALEWLSLK